MRTTGQVARAMGVTINTVKSWIRRGQLEAIRLPSGHYRIPVAELERLGGSMAEDLPDLYEKRRRQWEVVDAWARSQPIEERPLEQLLEWVDQMLELAQSFDGGVAEPSVEETIEHHMAVLHALAAIRR